MISKNRSINRGAVDAVTEKERSHLVDRSSDSRRTQRHEREECEFHSFVYNWGASETIHLMEASTVISSS